MRILHIVGTISPAAGGPTEVIRTLVQYAPAGYESEVASLDLPTESFLADFPCPVHALGSGKWYAPALTAWLRQNRSRFDGVIVHGLWTFAGVAVLQAIKGHVPYVVFPHGMLDPYFRRAFPAKHAKKWAYWLLSEYWVLRGADRVLFTTQVEADLATEMFELWSWKPMVTAIGGEAPPSNKEALLEGFYTHCPDLRDRRFLLFLGRIHPKKGCDLLIDAFGYAAVEHQTSEQRDFDLSLVMVGPNDSAYAKTLDTLVYQHCVEHLVHWPGLLTGDAKWGAFAACEAFILPSHQENFGVAVVEALASGKPVLLSNQINIAREIADDGCGYVEPDTLEGTRNLLERWLLTSPEQRERMSVQARATFAARYDMRRNAETILRVFEGLRAPHVTSQPLPEAR